jgi:hypothetical protein
MKDDLDYMEWVAGVTPGERAEEPKYGLRFNTAKIDLTQLSPVAQYLESCVFMMGQHKYGKSNYKKGKPTFDDVLTEMLGSAKRHLYYLDRGEWLDKESGMPHLAHAVWNLNRIMDFYYLGLTHMKDGKDLFHQPLQHELPEVPQKKESV